MSSFPGRSLRRLKAAPFLDAALVKARDDAGPHWSLPDALAPFPDLCVGGSHPCHCETPQSFHQTNVEDSN